MGGLGTVGLRSGAGEGWPTWLEVRSSQPVLACLASQYAGWSLAASKEETGSARSSSRSARVRRARWPSRKPLFDRTRLPRSRERGVLVLEVDRAPPDGGHRQAAARLRAGARGADADPHADHQRSPAPRRWWRACSRWRCTRRTNSASRWRTSSTASATAPLPAPSPDGVEAMGRTNDAILYGGRVHLTVRGDDDAARDLAQRLPSRNSRDHGRSFAEIFKARRATTSTRSTGACSRRPRCGSATSTAATPGTAAR